LIAVLSKMKKIAINFSDLALFNSSTCFQELTMQKPNPSKTIQQSNNQATYFLRYLSLTPVLAVVLSSLAISLWMIINYFYPDLLFHPLP
jgi:photosystem I subunit IX